MVRLLAVTWHETREDRDATRKIDGSSPPSTHVLTAFRLNAPLLHLIPWRNEKALGGGGGVMLGNWTSIANGNLS